ncbi:unnamed protein product [Sphenostylis stenocarpa]|uniref:Uncharacterized protein n=1 Tax=Sphenostylis stenocarpa TaxID=92480 RepID=A0AA86SZG2_9FABA|nr:unnamed protein product [Sphenostylis stenocarpa]
MVDKGVTVRHKMGPFEMTGRQKCKLRGSRPCAKSPGAVYMEIKKRSTIVKSNTKEMKEHTASHILKSQLQKNWEKKGCKQN